MVLQRVGCCPGRLCAPELVDEPVRRDDLVRTGEKECEQRPLPRAAEWERTALLDDLERSQDAELHVSSAARSGCGGDANTASSAQPRLSGASVSASTIRGRRPQRRRLEQEDGCRRERSDRDPDRLRVRRLSDRRADRPRWDGRRLPRLRPAAETDRRAEADGARAGAGSGASANASRARRSSPCRSSTRTSCRSTTQATSTVASTSRCASSRERT